MRRLFLLLGFALVVSVAAAKPYRIYSVPEGVRQTDMFEVEVSADSLKWERVPVVMTLSSIGRGHKRLSAEEFAEWGGYPKAPHLDKCAIASLSTTQKVWFRVSHPTAKSLTISPERRGVKAMMVDGKAVFSVEGGAKLMIKPDGDVVRTLSLLIDDDSKQLLNMRRFDHIIRFKKGYHTAANNPHIKLNEYGAPVLTIREDNTMVVLEEGAHICAAIDIRGAKGTRISGRGFINLLDRCYGADRNFEGELLGAFRENVVPAIYIHEGASNVLVQDITIITDFRCVTARNAEGIHLENVKMFSSAQNGDGVNVINTQHLQANNCYIHSQDDCFCGYNNCDSIRFLWDDEKFIKNKPTSDLVLTNSVVWTNCRPFVFGGHATGAKEPRCVMENILVENCEIIGMANSLHYEDDFTFKRYNTRTFWSGMMRILSQSEQIVRNITFSNIDVEWTKGYNGQPIHIAVRDNSKTSYKESQGYRIENIRFKNISFRNLNDVVMPIYMKAPCDVEGYGIYGVAFENVTFDGKPHTAVGMTLVGNVNL